MMDRSSLCRTTVVIGLLAGMIVSSTAEAQLFRRLQARRRMQTQPVPQPGIQPRAVAPNPYAPARPALAPGYRYAPQSPTGPVPPTQRALRVPSNPSGTRVPVTTQSPGRGIPQQNGLQQPIARYQRMPNGTYRALPIAPPRHRAPQLPNRNARHPTGLSPSPAIRSEPVRPTVPVEAHPVTPADAESNKKEFGGSILLQDGEEENESPNQESSSSLQHEKVQTTVSMGIDVYTPQPGAKWVRVARITAGSHAGQAGLKVGDRITSVDNKPSRTLAQLSSLIVSRKAGDQVRVQFIRNGKTHVISVPLIARVIEPVNAQEALSVVSNTATEDKLESTPPQESNSAGFSSRVHLGILVDDPHGLRGVTVTRVRKGTLAFLNGLRVGDRIVSFEGRMIADIDAFKREISSVDPGDSLVLGLVRDGKLISKSIATDEAASKMAQDELVAKVEQKSSSGGLTSGLRSVFGGLLGAGSDTSSPPQETEEPAEQQVRPATFDDNMAFGDNEPIHQSIFSKNRSEPTPKNPNRKNQRVIDQVLPPPKLDRVQGK